MIVHHDIGLGLRFLEGIAGEGAPFDRVVVGEAFPTGEILAVEEGSEPGRWGIVRIALEDGFGRRKIGDLEIAELHRVAVSGEGDAAGAVLAAVEPLFERGLFLEEGIDDHGAIEDDHDMILDRDDGLLVPLAHGLEVAGFRGHMTVDRTMHLPGLQPGKLARFSIHDRFSTVDLALVVEDLDLESVAGGVASGGHADADAVVRALLHLELEGEGEVAVVLCCLEILPSGLTDEDAVLHDVAGGVPGPTGEILAVEEILPVGRLEQGERTFRRFPVGIGFGRVLGRCGQGQQGDGRHAGHDKGQGAVPHDPL